MGYKVKWSTRAEQELDRETPNDDQKRALEDAMRRVEATLARDPRAVGVMKLVSTRLLTDPPLGVIYDIIEDDKLVVIASAWLIQ